jgi:hypothetical protein
MGISTITDLANPVPVYIAEISGISSVPLFTGGRVWFKDYFITHNRLSSYSICVKT